MINWIIFGIILGLIPVGVIGLRVLVGKGKPISAQQKQIANKRVIKYIVFYWLCDFFYFTCFQHHLVWQFILGVIIVAVVFCNLAFMFSSGRAKTPFETFGMVQDFLIGIGLTVYLIYIVPDEHLQGVLIPIVAAVYGGLLTLSGVAWTIRKGEKDRKEEEKKKYKPLVFIRNEETLPLNGEKEIPFSVDKKDMIVPVNCFRWACPEEENKYKIQYFYISNTEFSYCAIKGFIINAVSVEMKIGQVLDKNKIYCFSFVDEFVFDQDINSIGLLIQDMLDNYYEMELNYELFYDIDKNANIIKIKSGIEIKEIPTIKG